MSTFIDYFGSTVSRATAVVSEEPKRAKVTYRNESGQKFSVMVHQKPNPIGFAARLPGDGSNRRKAGK